MTPATKTDDAPDAVEPQPAQTDAAPNATPVKYAIENGVITCEGRPIGEVSDGVLVLDSGWMRLAGGHVRVMADRVNGENKRGGIAFER